MRPELDTFLKSMSLFFEVVELVFCDDDATGEHLSQFVFVFVDIDTEMTPIVVSKTFIVCGVQVGIWVSLVDEIEDGLNDGRGVFLALYLLHESSREWIITDHNNIFVHVIGVMVHGDVIIWVEV
jgi:hypothetical protein